ncbi:MAG: CDGSH iron-sulfur domain-containing protein [Actinomycetota bacterium]|nr:CDGSH iron-sulfur domain-containing protein [Actinomycetota bacterium]
MSDDDKRPRDPNEPAVIQSSDNGPLLVKGNFTVIDSEGNEFIVERKNAALCRCGGSGNKPFCDGTHEAINFRSAPRAAGDEVIEIPEPEKVTSN